MTYRDDFGSIDQPSEISIPRIINMLSARGLQVERSFDLQTARQAHRGCPCPHHGSDECSCQIVFLLVYGEDLHPATLVAHGRDGRTRFAMSNHPENNSTNLLEAEIRELLRAVNHLSSGQVDSCR